MKVGDIVLYTDPTDEGRGDPPSFPAIVYKIWDNSPKVRGMPFVGIHIFGEVSKKMAYVGYDHKQQGCYHLEKEVSNIDAAEAGKK